ncbi:condensation domain-containing protein [Streptomyces sp. NPDC052101]|uniref:condensation domain-containing protein n=1 Tax=Streptomyces sp. NPDC052101 TaxID=3155763 RepID=UPI00341A8AD3
MTSSLPADLTARLAALTPEARARLLARVRQQRRPQDRLTPGQLRLWDAHHDTGGRPVDVVCQAVQLTGARVDLDRLADRVRGFADAHDALRTTFETTDDGVRPVVHPTLPPALTRTRFADRASAHAAAKELAHQPFDLARGPLLRVVLAEGASAEEAWVLVVVHNLVFDAWSFELLLDELTRDEGSAPPAAIPFSRFAHEQAAWAASDAGQAAGRHWAAEVADAPAPLPTDRPRRTPSRRPGGRVTFTVPAAVAQGLAASARRAAATAYAAWLAVAWAALAEHGGTQDVLLGTFVAGRDRPGTEQSVGYLLNVLPVRLRDPGDGTHASRVRAVSTVTRAGLPHSAYPGELIDAPRRVPGTHPLFDAVFVFDNLGESTRTVQGAEVATADLDKDVARYDLTLAVYPDAEGASGWLEYDTDLYDPATAQRLAERFTALAEAAAQEADR